MLEDYAKAIEEYTNGDVTMRVFPLSLLSFAEVNAGVRDGIADAAANLTAYFPAEVPNLRICDAELPGMPDRSRGAKSGLSGGRVHHVLCIAVHGTADLYR